jgi:hypothetical protein
MFTVPRYWSKLKGEKGDHLTDHQQYNRLKQLLLPVLAEATIGNFKATIPHQKDQSAEFNEILMGVQSLLEVVSQQQQRITELESQIQDVQSGTTEILARVLDRNQTGAPQEVNL